MRHNKMLLLLTATAMLASCGGKSSSPNPSTAPSQETSSNSSAPLPSSDSDSSSSTPAPYVPKAEDFGVLLYQNGFIGQDGTLNVGLEQTTFTPEDAEQPIVYQTTNAGMETYTYAIGEKSYTEQLPTVYFGEDTRIRLSYGDYKFVMLEKLNKNNRWVADSQFMPATTEFSGVYNGYEEGSVDPNNVLYLISPVFEPGIAGYEMKGAFRANGALEQLNWSAQTFFIKEGDDYVLAMDFLDLEDGEYYNNPMAVSAKGLRTVSDDPDYRSDYFYADFSLLCGYLVDDKGNLLNYDYDTTDGLVDWNTYDTFGLAVAHHDAQGFYFTFGDTVSARMNGAGMSIDYGNNDVRKLAPLFTLYSGISSSTMTMSNSTMSVEFGNEFNWDTWENEFVCKVNGTAVESSFGVSDDFSAYISFTYQNEEYSLYRQTEYSAVLISYDVEYLYDYDYLDDIFVGTFYAIENGVITAITVNNNGTASVGSATLNDVAYAYNAEIESVVCTFGEYTLIDVYHENGLFLLHQGTQSPRYLISADALDDALGTYKGSFITDSNVVVEFTMESFSYRGIAATGLTFYYGLTDDGDISIIFSFLLNGVQFVFQPDFKGAANVFAISKTGGFTFRESCLVSDQYEDFCGDYIFYSEEYGEEHFIYSDTAGLWLTTATSSTTAELVQYTVYQFSHDSNGRVVITIAVSAGGQTIAVPFVQTGKYTISSPTGYTYLAAEYYRIQGVYYTDDCIVYVNGTSITVDGSARPNASVTAAANEIVLTLDDTHSVSFTDAGASLRNGDNDPVAMTAYNLVLADWVGTYSCANDDKVYELKIDETTGKLTAYIDGQFHWNVYSVILEDGSVALRFSALGTTLVFIYDGTSRTVKATTSGGIPVPPPMPS